MRRRRYIAAGIGCVFAWLAVGHAGPAWSQMDPAALQKRAVERIDAFVDNFRRTGDFRSRIGDLAQADLELAESNRLLTQRGDSRALAVGLIKRGHVYRMQGRWNEAIPFYDRAEQVAAGDAGCRPPGGGRGLAWAHSQLARNRRRGARGWHPSGPPCRNDDGQGRARENPGYPRRGADRAGQSRRCCRYGEPRDRCGIADDGSQRAVLRVSQPLRCLSEGRREVRRAARISAVLPGRRALPGGPAAGAARGAPGWLP